MKRIDTSFKKLIEGKPLTFLIGAGCSVDKPSCLPAGREMMEALIEVSCAESEHEKLLNIDGLRFELLVEIIRDSLDPELIIINYYTTSESPNTAFFYC